MTKVIAGPNDNPPWCDHSNCQVVTHIPYEFHHPRETSVCLGRLPSVEVDVVPEDPAMTCHRNTHRLCLHSSRLDRETVEFKIYRGDMHNFIEIFQAGLKDCEQ